MEKLSYLHGIILPFRQLTERFVYIYHVHKQIDTEVFRLSLHDFYRHDINNNKDTVLLKLDF